MSNCTYRSFSPIAAAANNPTGRNLIAFEDKFLLKIKVTKQRELVINGNFVTLKVYIRRPEGHVIIFLFQRYPYFRRADRMICVIFRANCTNMDNELGFLEGCTPTIKNTSTAKKAKKNKKRNRIAKI